MQKNNNKKRVTGERSISGKTQADQYRRKLEDVFSGQEPIAKISLDVNSEALPVFKSARDARGCQNDIKQKKMEGRWHVGEVTHDRCHGHVFRPPYFFKLTLAPKNKDFQQTTRREKAWKAKAAAPAQQSTGPDAKPPTQSPHMLLWPAALVWLNAPANPHPHHQASQPPPLPQAFLSMPPPVIYSLNDKTQTSTHSSLESEDNHITADDRDANQT